MRDGEELAAKLRAIGISTAERLTYALETLDRSDLWIYIACDRDGEGQLKPINATGFYPDEFSAGLAGETYVRDWQEKMADDDPPPEVFAIPLFIEAPGG